MSETYIISGEARILKHLRESSKVMDYMKATDEELVNLIKTNKDKKATEVLLKRYEGLVRHVAGNYFIKGGDKDDLAQEGLLAVVDAIQNFVPAKNKNFKQFAMLAVKRNIMDAIDKANTKKRSPLNDYVPYGDELKLVSKNNPEKIAINREAQRRIQDYMKKNLTSHESAVLNWYLQGLTYPEIADKLGINRRSVDNAMQKVRSKMRTYKDKFRDSRIISIIEAILIDDREKLKESLAHKYFFGK